MPMNSPPPNPRHEKPFVVGPTDATATTPAKTEDTDIYADFVARARDMAERLRQRELESERLLQITERINLGLTLEEVLDFLYQELRGVIPYHRIGFALVDRARGMVVARWARSDRDMQISKGYEAPLKGSSLGRVLETGRPRIINDLEAYLGEKPESDATRRAVAEGIRASLTCPLFVQGKPVGFVFFSSVEKNAYSDAHVAFFQEIAGHLAATVEKSRLYSELAEQKGLVERQNAVMVQELEMARHVQQALIPTWIPDVPGLEIAFAYEPAIQVGGDILDILPVGEDRLLLFVGDAMGHGVQAALVMSAVKAALKSAVDAQGDPAKALAALNRVLADLLDDFFVTAACALIEGRTGQIQVALAGHAAPLWFRAGSGQVAQHGESDPALGISKERTYAATALRLEPGDLLLFCTDGVAEAMDADGREYGMERLKRQLTQQPQPAPQSLLDAIRRDVDAHRGDRPMSDDYTLLIVRRS